MSGVWLVAAICLVQTAAGLTIPLEDDLYSDLQDFLKKVHYSRVATSPREVPGWGAGEELGQVTGVSVDPEGHPVIVHRGPRIWDHTSFNASHHFQGGEAIAVDVVVVLDAATGSRRRSWGGGRFLLPHGLTVDVAGNTWITDVGLHQVFKFTGDGGEAAMVLGEARIPGSDKRHFCKPTAVAVASNGEFYVADGYCNGRVIRYDADGTFKGSFGHIGDDGGPATLWVPHGLALDEARNLLCVADREERRGLCLPAGLHFTNHALVTIALPNHARVFDLATVNGVVVGVAGSSEEGGASGFTADLDTGKLLDTWAPQVGFTNPHAIATSADGEAIYVVEIGPNRVWKFTLDAAVNNPAY